MDHAAIAAETRRYIADNFLYTRPAFQLGDDDRLLEKGIIDSMGVMELVTFLQDRFGVTVEERDITEEHFGSISAIVDYVVARRVSARRVGGNGS